MANRRKQVRKKAAPLGPKVKLEDHLLLQVDGQAEKDHALSWDVLKKIGDTTQALIEKLVRYSLDSQPIDPRSIKLEIIGFHKGSAVPEMRLASNTGENLFPKSMAFKTLNSDFSFVLGCINTGNFQAIADRYTYPGVKNDVVEAVYEFTNAAGTKPLRIVEREKGDGFRPIAKIRRMKPEIREKLRVPLLEAYSQIEPEYSEAVGKITVSISSKGRRVQKVKQLYSEKEASLSLRFDSIETPERIYLLTHEVLFALHGDEQAKSFSIEHPLLDLYAVGKTMELAEEDLFYQFDHTYRRLTELKDEQLGDHLRNAKHYIEMIVQQVKDK